MNYQRFFVILLSVMLVVWTTVCKAQNEYFSLPSQYRIGAGAFGNAYFHSASFSELPGVPTCCPHYDNGTGLGSSFGIFFQKPLATGLSLALWAGASDINAKYSSNEQKSVIVSNALQSASIHHSLETDITTLYFEAQFSAQFSVIFSGYIGLRGDYFAKSSFQQREELLAPETGVFENGSRIRNAFSGAMSGNNRGMISPVLGVRFDLPLDSNRTLFLFPELSFGLSITDLANFTPWSVQFIRAGAAFGWHFQKE